MTHHYKIIAELLLATFVAAFLNVVCLASLHANEPATFGDVVWGLEESVFAYGTLLVTGIIFAFLKKYRVINFVIFLLISIMSFVLLHNLVVLILNSDIQSQPITILIDAGLIWVSGLLIFALWYWIIDGGGPIQRDRDYDVAKIDLLFPQLQTHLKNRKEWKPQYLDYFFFSYFTSSSFAPADTLPLTKRVKVLMMLQASLSLVIIGMVVSRAISLLN